MASINIAVIGATGTVGSVLLEILENRDFPTGKIRVCSSPRSIGNKISFAGQELTLEQANLELFSDMDLVFIAAGSDISKKIAPIAAEAGTLVIDKSSAFRMDPKVPLVVPEVNLDDLAYHSGIVATPNCSTTQMVLALKPLQDANPIRRVIVDTYQSVSGSGRHALTELEDQTQRVLNGKNITPSVYAHPIAFNVFPHIDSFQPNGYTNEEMKLVYETRKIMHLPKLPISATCTRIPVSVGHSEAIHIEFESPINPKQVTEILSEAPGVAILDDTQANVYPTPVNATGKDEVFVGRIRSDISNNNSIALWVVGDNLRKGAALNAVQIAEEALAQNLL